MRHDRGLIEKAPCGYLVFGEDSEILYMNERLRGWIGITDDTDPVTKATHLFSRASRVVFETTVLPVLSLRGRVDGASLDLRDQAGNNIPVLLSGETEKTEAGSLTRLVILEASARRGFERELTTARAEAVAKLALKEREAELREQFVAILGHDLRNPIASVQSVIRILSREDLSERGQSTILLAQSIIQRMARLVDNTLDFARHRLGGGLAVQLAEVSGLEDHISNIVSEFRTAQPDRDIELRIALPPTVRCDVWRIGQLLANLLGNALTHGDATHPVVVEAVTKDDSTFEINVRNHGEQISTENAERLFDPFVRSLGDGNRKGLGLGLYIASEISKAHGGSLSFTSDENETVFTFKMPL